MKKQPSRLFSINSISEQHRLLSLPKPLHPLVSVFKFRDIKSNEVELSEQFAMNFYCIAIKKNFKGKLKYGQHYYDFDEGVMSFIAPGQVLSSNDPGQDPTEGCCLVFHPDLLANYALGKNIKNFGFFSYSLSEALHLSEREEQMIEGLFENIRTEYETNIDQYSRDVIVSQIELLLNYSNRFYNRQFITRRNAGNDLLANMETILEEYFSSNKALRHGIPTVQHIAGLLNVSTSYLGDMLRNLTGQNTQQHIHHVLIEKAKEKLSTSDMPVNEIAYMLGFEHPQSFHKLFKSKTEVSPLKYRALFN